MIRRLSDICLPLPGASTMYSDIIHILVYWWVSDWTDACQSLLQRARTSGRKMMLDLSVAAPDIAPSLIAVWHRGNPHDICVSEMLRVVRFPRH